MREGQREEASIKAAYDPGGQSENQAAVDAERITCSSGGPVGGASPA